MRFASAKTAGSECATPWPGSVIEASRSGCIEQQKKSQDEVLLANLWVNRTLAPSPDFPDPQILPRSLKQGPAPLGPSAALLRRPRL